MVDVQSLLQNSKSAKMVRSRSSRSAANTPRRSRTRRRRCAHERDALQRQQASLSAEALNQKGREFQQKVNDLERSVQGKRQALEKSNAEALAKIQEQMLKIITDIAKDRKANLVFQRSELVLFDQGFDVTDEVLQKLDEQMPTLTVNFVAPRRRQPTAARRRHRAQPARTHRPSRRRNRALGMPAGRAQMADRASSIEPDRLRSMRWPH